MIEGFDHLDFIELLHALGLEFDPWDIFDRQEQELHKNAQKEHLELLLDWEAKTNAYQLMLVDLHFNLVPNIIMEYVILRISAILNRINLTKSRAQ